MEKVIITLRRPVPDEAWCERLRGPVASSLLDLGLPGVAVNVRDGAVRDSLMTLTTLDPPVVGLVTAWVEQSTEIRFVQPWTCWPANAIRSPLTW